MPAPDDAEVEMGINLGSDDEVMVTAIITKDGEVVDVRSLKPSQPWITNLAPFGDH